MTEHNIQNRKSILLTGCAGFIGSNFVPYFLEKYPEYYIVNLDLLTYAGNLKNLEGKPMRIFESDIVKTIHWYLEKYQ